MRFFLSLSGAGSRCFLQVFEMVILFNRDCLVHQIAYKKHFCFHKKYVQLCWKTWSCSFPELPKRRCFLFLQENIIFLKYKSYNMLFLTKISCEKNSCSSTLHLTQGTSFSCCSFSFRVQPDQKCSGCRAMVLFSFGKHGFVLAGWEGTELFGAKFAVTSGCGISGCGENPQQRMELVLEVFGLFFFPLKKKILILIFSAF